MSDSSSADRSSEIPSESAGDNSAPDTRGVVPEAESRFLAEGFGAYLKVLRKQAGLSQDQAASLSGLTSSHLSKLERGLRRPGVPAVKALARILAPVGEVEAIEQRLAGLAGDSLREGADRNKLMAENRNRRKAVAGFDQSLSRLRRMIRQQEAAGRTVSDTARSLAEKGGRTVERLKATPDRKPESIPGFELAHVPRAPRKLPYRATFAQITELLDDEDDE